MMLCSSVYQPASKNSPPDYGMLFESQLIFRVNFSLHSSFTELEEFMKIVQPREVRCIVGNTNSLANTMHNKDANSSMGGDAGFLAHFKKYLNPSKKVSALLCFTSSCWSRTEVMYSLVSMNQIKFGRKRGKK